MTGRIRRYGLRCAVACFNGLLALNSGGKGVAQQVAKPSSAPVQQPGGEIRDLSLAESVTLSTPPPAALLSETKCDLKGNIYVVQSAGPPSLIGSGGLSGIPVSKLSIDSKSTVAYPVPALDRYRGVIRSDFDVDADGSLYSLLEAVDAVATEKNGAPSFFVAKYHDDGSLDSYFKLRDTEERHLQPFRFAMFRSGNVLVTGTALTEGKRLRPFIAVFDSDGRFVRDVNVPDNSKAAPAVPSPRGVAGQGEPTPESAPESEKSESESDRAVSLSSSSLILSAADGNVYLLRDAAHPRLYVISSAGGVIRDLQISVPAPGLTATNMAMDGSDRVFISFGQVKSISANPAPSDIPNHLISVINPQTGDVSAVYRLPMEADAFNIPACAASPDNFLFLGATSDQQHQQIAGYALRSF